MLTASASGFWSGWNFRVPKKLQTSQGTTRARLVVADKFLKQLHISHLSEMNRAICGLNMVFRETRLMSFLPTSCFADISFQKFSPSISRLID